MATTKETGMDDEGLLGFYQDYFNSFPIYKDENWELYKAMGGKTVGLITLLSSMWKSRKRLAKKKISASRNNRPSKVSWMMGGVLVFDKAGELVFVMEEIPGKEFDMEQIKLAIEEARSMDTSHTSCNSIDTMGDSLTSQM